ncbi:hypothetical protein XENOCAPTIV_014290 [Xenoophorus captivus]|uniref:Uncharacterized protein n=1 Tax=Xenoophorus captivus TaxID=1517983 RepID=A0ABV0S0J5_9TELE
MCIDSFHTVICFSRAGQVIVIIKAEMKSPNKNITYQKIYILHKNTQYIRSVLPGLRRNRTGLLLSGPKSLLDESIAFIYLEIKVPESGGRVERNRIHVFSSPE